MIIPLMLNFAMVSGKACHIFCPRLPHTPSLPCCYHITDWSSLKCTRWPLCFLLLPLLLSSFLSFMPSLPRSLPSSQPALTLLAVSWGAEADEGWLRLLWLLQGHRLHRRFQRRLRAAVSAAARAPGRRPRLQQRAYVLRVRTPDHRSLLHLFIYSFIYLGRDFKATALPRACYLNNEMLIRGY